MKNTPLLTVPNVNNGEYKVLNDKIEHHRAGKKHIAKFAIDTKIVKNPAQIEIGANSEQELITKVQKFLCV